MNDPSPSTGQQVVIGAGFGLPVAEDQRPYVSPEELMTGAGVEGLFAAKDNSASVSVEEYMTNPIYAPPRTTSRRQSPPPPPPRFRSPLEPQLFRRSL